MNYNFDEVIDRTQSSAVKIEEMKKIWGRTDLIPMWVADMDFATPNFILNAVKQRCEHPILGYTTKPDSYFNSIIHWIKTRHHMEVTKEQLTYVPGIVAGLGIAIHAFTQPGDKIMIMTPVYPPFSWLVTRNGRTLVTCPLVLENGSYRMNFACMEEKLKDVKMLILCNPHNPGGIVWSNEELERVANLCAENNVLVLSDEIHADLTLSPHQHLPFAIVSDKAKYNSVTFMAPSKTFNMPGVAASHAITFNENIRKVLVDYIESSELGAGHVFAYPAVEAAYTHGNEWLDECLAYVKANIEHTLERLRTAMPKIKPIVPNASFLIWLDCRALGLNQKELNRFFADKAGLALNDGETFGKEGVGFMRMNIACPRSILDKALRQLEDAYHTL